MFDESLHSGHLESYFPLAEQFITQNQPAFCGISSVVMVLNALKVDPGPGLRVWRGIWRWFAEDNLILPKDLAVVEREGITVDEFEQITECNGARCSTYRPYDTSEEFFRQAIMDTTSRRTIKHPSFLVVSFSRKTLGKSKREGKKTCCNDGPKRVQSCFHRCQVVSTQQIFTKIRKTPSKCYSVFTALFSFFLFLLLFFFLDEHSNPTGQTGDGHFSPIAAYHPETDSALVLDVARFKYPPYWCPVSTLWKAMAPIDNVTGQPRGFFMLSPPNVCTCQEEKEKEKERYKEKEK